MIETTQSTSFSSREWDTHDSQNIEKMNSNPNIKTVGCLPYNFMQCENECAKQKTPLQQSRYLILICCTIYVACTGSVYYGWPGFSNMLFRDGAFDWLCPTNSHVPHKRYSCEDQDTAVQRLFQIAMPCQYIMSLVAGTLIDNLGPRFTAVLGQTINFTAWLLLSFANQNFNVYVLCFVLIGMGADTGFLPTLQTSNLFPGYNGVIIAVLGAANSASFAVPTIMDLIQKNFQVSFKSICYGYMFIIFCMWLYAAFCLPIKSFYPLEHFTSTPENKDLKEIKKSGFSRLLADLKGLPQNLKASKEQLLSKKFIAIALYFCTTSLVFNFFIVSGEHLLTTSVNTFYGIINPFSFLPTIVYGKLVDTIGPVRVMAINTTFGLMSYVFGNIPFIVAKYIASIFMTIYVSIYTSQMYFFIKDRFHDQHFGKLVGTASLCGGLSAVIAVYLYDPLTKDTFNGNFLYVSIVMMAFCLLNYCLLYFMRGHSRFMEQKEMRKVTTL